MGDPLVISRLVAGGYAAIGAGAVLRPSLVPAVFGGSARTPESRTEVRAVYAGIPLAFAAALLRSEGQQPAARSAVLRTVGDASAGMAVARLGGALLERRLRAWPTAAFLALEAALAVACSAAARVQEVPPKP
ncbi:DUF4345 domain-containing protein [Blastococcus sp. TBT05-19]|uniref:DUF4345 family protein n=1 Tax=Blastococcus sp. TBT05-19 TaxID=2250581 RepID=UPI000DE9A0DB|nr:DUF4345 family protein [Blastococcus sp. TBT05-19]RBY94887.1 DUF4345 domain-containing protein [Blastococcus sp. TBT05-19]